MSEKASYVIERDCTGMDYTLYKKWRGAFYKFCIDQYALFKDRLMISANTEEVADNAHRYSHSIRPLMRHEIPGCLL